MVNDNVLLELQRIVDESEILEYVYDHTSSYILNTL